MAVFYGAEKSTLMQMMATVDFPTKGNIRYGGKDIFGMDEGYRSLIGYMPQDYSVYPGFTAKDFLEYMGVLEDIPKRKLKHRIMEVLEFVLILTVIYIGMFVFLLGRREKKYYLN